MVASNALLQWELDVSMLEVQDWFGFEIAAAIYHRRGEADCMIGRIIETMRNRCEFAWRDTLLLAGATHDPVDVREERFIKVPPPSTNE